MQTDIRTKINSIKCKIQKWLYEYKHDSGAVDDNVLKSMWDCKRQHDVCGQITRMGKHTGMHYRYKFGINVARTTVDYLSLIISQRDCQLHKTI